MYAAPTASSVAPVSCASARCCAAQLEPSRASTPLVAGSGTAWSASCRAERRCRGFLAAPFIHAFEPKILRAVGGNEIGVKVRGTSREEGGADRAWVSGGGSKPGASLLRAEVGPPGGCRAAATEVTWPEALPEGRTSGRSHPELAERTPARRGPFYLWQPELPVRRSEPGPPRGCRLRPPRCAYATACCRSDGVLGQS